MAFDRSVDPRRDLADVDIGRFSLMLDHGRE